MPVPSVLALVSVADGASIVAADHRNNYASIQAAVNALIGFFAAGAAGATLRYNGTDWAKTVNIILDDANSKITLGGDAAFSRSAVNTLLSTANWQFSGGWRIPGALLAAIGATVGAASGGPGLLLESVNVAGAVPATPTNGGVVYAENGALKYKGSAGTVTVLAPA